MEKENQCYFLLCRNYSKLKVSAFPIIIRLLCPLAASGRGKSQYHAVANAFNEANCQCLARHNARQMHPETQQQEAAEGWNKECKKHVKIELPCQKNHTILLSH